MPEKSKFRALNRLPDGSGYPGIDVLLSGVVDVASAYGVNVLHHAVNGTPLRGYAALELVVSTLQDVNDPPCMFLMSALPENMRSATTSPAAGAALVAANSVPRVVI
ncbi:hypothetical protein DIPPA_27762 [Diplonema papillatum]|nr:hypothetical protein DIPPA_27762 [Diplonema papillatum]